MFSLSVNVVIEFTLPQVVAAAAVTALTGLPFNVAGIVNEVTLVLKTNVPLPITLYETTTLSSFTSSYSKSCPYTLNIPCTAPLVT